ncbi:vomeronasal type-2 receptor 1-like [Amia ocellicauda]|uniref:vomeronasal type-2 receptor 1-like n=1 Tax=Amia ocellicauda TaxID=2972642 RepID=UPI003464BECF
MPKKDHEKKNGSFLALLAEGYSECRVASTLKMSKTAVHKNKTSECKIAAESDKLAMVKQGDVTIGGLFSIHDTVMEPDQAFTSKPVSMRCTGFNFRTFRWSQTMIYAIEEINKDGNLLPNITLGYKIYDSCNTNFHALKAAVTLMNGQDETVTGYSCNPSVPVVMGDGGSTLSIVVARFLGIFNVPQVSYFSTCACLSDKREFPAFLRTIPSDFFQVEALVQLVQRFGWTWVGTVAGDDDYGRRGVQIFNEEVKKCGVCIAFYEVVPKNHARDKMSKIVETIKASRARVILVFSLEQDARALFHEVLRQNVSGIQWLASEAWITAALLATPEFSSLLDGSVGFAIRRAEIPGLKQFLLRLRPSMLMCTGTEDLARVNNVYSDVTQLRISYNVYKAVYAIAHSLDDMSKCENGSGPLEHKSCPNISDFEPWQQSDEVFKPLFGHCIKRHYVFSEVMGYGVSYLLVTS